MFGANKLPAVMAAAHLERQTDDKSPGHCSSSNGNSASSLKMTSQQGKTMSEDRTKAKNVTKADPVRPHFRIDWRQLSYYQRPKSFLARCLTSERGVFELGANQKKPEVSQPKRILNELDGCFCSGQLSAILGPSGAGKTTFLSTMFGSKQDEGFGLTKVTWINEPDNEQRANKRRPLKIAFLPQHDHLLHHLTVYETLMFASKIKNATTKAGQSKNFHRLNVKRVAKMLKLSECLYTRCNKLSGGQYKRVSIGQELLSNPDVIILDEPTSGLDAMTCLSTVQTLKSIVSKQPMSIILTIHQPDMDVFRLFDRVYVIAQGGLAIYEGPPDGILPTLAAVDLHPPHPDYNPARFIVENSFVIEPGTQSRTHLADEGSISSESESDSDSDSDEEQATKNYLKRSLMSLSDAISGRELGSDPKARQRDKKPLLNIGVQTSDGQLITSDQLSKHEHQIRADATKYEKISLLKQLNQIQKSRYYFNGQVNHDDLMSDLSSPSGRSSVLNPLSSENECSMVLDKASTGTTTKSDYSSAGSQALPAASKSKPSSLSNIPDCLDTCELDNLGSARDGTEASARMVDSCLSGRESTVSSPEIVISFGSATSRSSSPRSGSTRKEGSPRRQFDKRLSARHNCSKQESPIWYHTFLLTHRTWLSIIRDPIFFGIQAALHTFIPILLALIFGSIQEEGCPKLGSFDLVQFAYSDSDNLIEQTMRSIRSSIGNIGVIFFEMFVLSFAINCITALVFPLDMYVLLKEYRNGWYAMRSYFFGRTLADLPVPIVLHSIGMSILYFMTGQPHSIWRYSMIILMVIIASLVAQSIGLTIGAILMKSSQSAVLTAAGIVAPFFALSGFIVRIHTLPIFAQIAAKASFLYHMLNGFIILRYGFGRCACDDQELDSVEAHRVPENIRTLASMWIGTYSDEFTNSTAVMLHQRANRTNIDPNIDIVEKMMNSLKIANSYGHKIDQCSDVIPYAMLDFNLRDRDIYECFYALLIMLVVSRFITFSAIYYKIRSFT